MTESRTEQTGEEMARARAERTELAGHWAERAEHFHEGDAGEVAGEQRSLTRDALRRFRANRLAMASLALIVLYVLLSILVPMLDDSSTTINFDEALKGPSFEHPFGTSPQGKDLWNQAWAGGRISLSIAAVVSLVILVIGVTYGSISGFFGGRVDTVMMRLLDALYGLPYLPFAIIAVVIVKGQFPEANPLWYMVPALSLTTWFTAARIMRGQMLSLKQNDYVETARAQGAGSARVIGRHVLPNAVGVMVVAMFLEVPAAILGESFLSYLGLGVQPPDASWGRLAQEGDQYFRVQPQLILIPSFLIASTVLAAIAIADGVRDALDPRTDTH